MLKIDDQKSKNLKYLSPLIAVIVPALIFSTLNINVGAVKPTKNDCITIQSGTLLDVKDNTIGLGYDQYGYNYQAHMFNGNYSDYMRGDSVPSVPGGDYRLMMNWNDAWLSNKSCDGDNYLDRHYGYASYQGSGAWLTNHASGTYTDYVWDIAGAYTFHIHYSDNDYYYPVTLTQSESNITGTLTDNYLPSQYPDKVLTLTGTITGDDFTFTVQYPGNFWGKRTFTGSVDSSGGLSGGWVDDGTGSGAGTWSTSDGTAQKVYETCTWSDFIKIVAVPNGAQDSDPSVINSGVWTVDGKEIGPEIWGSFAIIQEISDDPCGQVEDLSNYKSDLRAGLGNW